MDLVANDPFPARTASTGHPRHRMAELPDLPAACPQRALIGEMAAAAAGRTIMRASTPAALPRWSAASPGGEKEPIGGAAPPAARLGARRHRRQPPAAYVDGQRFKFSRPPPAPRRHRDAELEWVRCRSARRRRRHRPRPADIPAANALVGVTVADGGTTCCQHVAPSVDLAALCCLAAANSFTAATGRRKAATGDLLTIRSTDAGAAAMGIKLDRNSASPAAADVLGDLQIAGRRRRRRASSSPSCAASCATPPPPRPGEFQILQLLAGSLTTALAIPQWPGGRRRHGGFQGTGTLNAAGFYRDGAALPFQRWPRPASSSPRAACRHPDARAWPWCRCWW